MLIFAIILSHLTWGQKDLQNGFGELTKAYYEDGLKLNPFGATLNNGDNRYNGQFELDIGEEYLKNFSNYYRKYKSLLKGIDRTHLTKDQQISYDVLLWECNIYIEGTKFPTYLVPINQLWCTPIVVGQQANGAGAQPFKTVEDYDNWLKRLDGFSKWCDLAIDRMKQGIKKGWTLPKPLTEKMIPQYENLAKGTAEEHLYFGPIKAFPASFSMADQRRLTAAYKEEINGSIIPTFQRLSDFLRNEYLPNSRTSHGISQVPGGREYYNYLIKFQTTTTMDADDIHNIGLIEVARIRGAMEQVKQQVGFNGDLMSFFDFVRSNKKLMPFKNAQEVLDNFHQIHARIEPKVSKIFDLRPTIPFEVRRVEAFREVSSSPHYIPGAPDGSRPGVFYVPVPDAFKYNTYTDESLFLHEAIPGHHFQASLAAENRDVPDFRRFVWYGAYGEGWALYCESLGEELGLFEDPYQYFGMLGLEMHRAIRLVVDTGLHTKGWTREQAIAYSLENEALAEPVVVSEVERYMAWPGQALSYKIGQLKIQQLRKVAEEKLGEKFDIKVFHNTILESGGVPLKILEDRIMEWIEGKA